MDSKLIDASAEFAVKIIRLCDRIDSHQAVINRFESSGASIGANIYIASSIANHDDEISKLNETLELCCETEYWLGILFKADLISKSSFNDLQYECETLKKMIISTINPENDNPNRSIIK